MILDEDQILSWIMPDASLLLTAQQKHEATQELIRKHFDPVVEDPSARVLALQRRPHLRHWSGFWREGDWMRFAGAELTPWMQEHPEGPPLRASANLDPDLRHVHVEFVMPGPDHNIRVTMLLDEAGNIIEHQREVEK